MGKWKKLQAGFSGFMAIAVLAGSISVRAATQDQMAVYEGELICGQEEHTHDRSCYELASASDAEKETTDIVCGLEEHVHDAGCYESGEGETGSLTPTEGSPAGQAPGVEEMGAEGSGAGDTVPVGTLQADSGTGGSSIEDADLEEKEPEGTDPEAGIAPLSEDVVREGDTFRVWSFAGLQEAVDRAKEEKDYQIQLEEDIDWDEQVEFSSWPTSLNLNLNGHSITISTSDAISVGKGLTIQGTGRETITVAPSAKAIDGRDNYIIAGEGVHLDNVRITAESNKEKLPPLLKVSVAGEICTLNNVIVEDYPVDRCLILIEPPMVYEAPPSLTIKDSVFSGIRSDAGVVGGGPIRYETTYCHPGKIVIDDTVFRENITEREGGTISVLSRYGLEINGGSFEGNQAVSGSAIYVAGFFDRDFDNHNVHINRTRFINNTATGVGGAIYFEEKSLSITDGYFEGNKAVSGGAIYCGPGRFIPCTLELEGDTSFKDNRATISGGAVCMEEDASEDGTSRSRLILHDAVITGNHVSEGTGHTVECVHSLEMEGGRCPAVFDNRPEGVADMYLPSLAEACTVYGTMLGEGGAELGIVSGSDGDERTLHKGENATIDPARDGAVSLTFHPSDKEKKTARALSPVVRMEGNTAGETGSAIYGMAVTFITSEREIPPEPEPEKPDPEKPDPEKPEPVKPDPEGPEPVTPDLEDPDPADPAPVVPAPSQTSSASSGGRRRRDRDRSVTGADSSTTAGSASTPGMSITKPHYIHTVLGGRELSGTRPGWRLKKPDGSYAASEWVLETDGSWYLYGEDGYTCNGWQKVNGEWYYFDETTQNMKTDWVTIDGKWYYLDTAQGSMETGWVMLDGKWYFLGTDGALVTNGYTPDGFYVNDKGEWVRR